MSEYREKNIRGEVVQLRRIADAIERERNYRSGEVTELRGIRNAIEEILHLVKKDQEDSAARQRQWDKEKK
tara:strand:- start:120 stop:332 length:213 start_codon:yes stop_codon:yes gene_type:complete